MRSPRTLLRALVVIAAVAAAPAGLSLPASAVDGGPGHGPTARGVVGGVTATATCPAGQVALSGGFASDGSLSVISNLRSARDEWTVRAADTATTPTAYVVCSGDTRVTVVTETATFPDDNSDHLALVARCPDGRQPVGGGWDYADPNTVNSNVYTSRPVKRGWKVRAFSNNGSANDLSVHAYCAPVRTDVRTVSSAPTAQPAALAAKVSCGSGRSALGGGFSTSPKSDFYNQDGPDAFYEVSRPTGRSSWRVQATNYSGFAGEVHTTAYVVCGT